VQIRVIKSRADNPLFDLHGACAIAARTFGFRLIPPETAKNFEDAVEDIGGSLQRETHWVFDDTSAAEIRGETWNLDRFTKAFLDLDWCNANADSPVANLRHYHENLACYRAHFQAHRPMIRLRKGDRVLTLRADATEEEKAKWLKLL
jgi:hypothetical protein